MTKLDSRNGVKCMSDKKRIAVVFGGQSSEHEVSRNSAQSVLENINRDKYDVTMIGITRDGRWLTYDGPVHLIGTGEWQAIAESKAQGTLTAVDSSARGILKAAGAEKENKKIDVVFPVLHGCNGEDGTIQGLFELAGIPYVGCGVLGSALGMDKVYSKIIFEKIGIPQAEYLIFTRKQIIQNIEVSIKQVEDILSYPCFVKPANTGSSVGISKARNREELKESFNLAIKYDRKIIVEEFMDAIEAECAVLGNDEPIVSTVGQIVPCNEFYDYDAKYRIDGGSTAIIPINLPEDIINKVREYAAKAFKALDCSGLARADFFILKGTNEVYINELNTLPGFTKTSMYPKCWSVSGLPYDKLIEKLIDLAIDRFEDNKRDIY